MKPSLRNLMSALFMPMLMTATAQSVTTTPALIDENTKDIVITFHSDGGNRGLIDATASTPIYAHTGVITNKSKSVSDWKQTPTWGDNSDKFKLTYVEPFTWQLTIPDIRSYYDITDPTEHIEKLAFVFRNSTGSSEAKTSTGGDILVEVFPKEFPTSRQADYPGGTPKMGARQNADGSVTFCLAAPDKNNCNIVGSWDDYAISSSNTMNYQEVNGVRYFWHTVENLEKGKDYMYYYLVDGSIRIGDPYANLILDPFNDQYIPSQVFPSIPEYPSDKIQKVPLAVYNSEQNEYDWKVDNFKGVRQNDLIIYELLIRDFTGTEGKAFGDGTVTGAIGKLDYLKDLGVNAIELLPIMEFGGNNSWGYNTNFYMAPDKAYGTPDDYRALIDGAHERGMAVILDIVFNQSDGMHPWYEMARRNISPFYNGSAPHSYSVLNDWNQDCELVQQQWRDALDYWLTYYKVDGFRFDLVKGLGDNDSYGNTYDPSTNTWNAPVESNTNKFNASRIARMKALRDHIISIKPDAYFINENLAGSQEENDMARDGEINWANVNWSARNYVTGIGDMSLVRFYAPYDDRLWGSTISYAESHDEERTAYGATSQDGSVVKGSYTDLCLRIGSMAAQMLLSPGAHMIWQFEELGNMTPTKKYDNNNNPTENLTDPKKVSWNDLNKTVQRGLHDTFATLCNIRKEHPDLFMETAASDIQLSSATSRYISLSNGSKELYLVVNPAAKKPTESTVIPFPKNPATGTTANLSDSKYELITSSHNESPLLTDNGVRLKAGTFAVYGTDLESGIDDTTIDNSVGKQPQISDENGYIHIHSPYSNLSIHNLSGISLPVGSRLSPGVYIVRVDSKSVKVAVM